MVNSKKIVYSIIFLSLLCSAGIVSAQIQPPPGVPQDFTALLTQIADKVGEIVRDLGIIMVIVAGVLYLTAAGNPQRISTANKALLFAIVGIAIGMAAHQIVNIVKETIGAQGGT